MCSFQQLYHDGDNGCVIQCKDCGNIQIAYGNIILTFGRNEFTAFRTWLKELEQTQPFQPGTSHIKGIVVPMPCEGIQLLLTQKELKTLNLMLDAADSELQSLALMQMFNTV